MIKNLLKDSFIYGVSKYLSAFAAIFLMPIYTRELSKADYGVMDLFNSWNSLLIMILPLGLITSIFRFYHDFKKDPTERKNHLGTIFIAIIALSLIYLIISISFKDQFVNLIQHNQSEEIYYHSIFIVIGGTLLTYFLTIAQSKYEKYKYLILSLVNLSLLISLGFIFVHTLEMHAVGFFRASTIALGSSLILAIIFYRSDIVLIFKLKLLKRLLKYSVHILSVGLLFGATNLIDRYLLMQYSGLEDVGIYSVGVRISSILGLGISSFAIAWFPRAMQIKDDVELRDRTYSKVHNLYMVLAFFGVIALTLMRSEIIAIIAPQYQGSYNIISILCLSLVVNGAIYFYTLALHIKSKTKYLTFAAIISIMVNIIVSIFLLGLMGIDGVAWGTLAGGIVWVLIQYYISNRFIRIKFNHLYPIVGLIGFTLVFILSNLIDNLDLSLFITIPIKSVILFVLLILIIRRLNNKYDIRKLLSS
ncbi:MAG: O-antigen/teichoic acid export membrane protein [Salibacteraceae bacterium]|jgi:O-antigen/teichoic acid export membrane protein